MQLILEDENKILESEVVESINEATGSTKKDYYLSGIFSTAGVKNGNGREYPRFIWEREVSLYQEKIKDNHIHTLGEWEHPTRADVDPMKAVIKITELRLEGDYVYGKAKILDNPEGARLKVLIDEGIKIDISSRGVGSVGKNGIVEEFKLITYDLVSKASNPGSHLSGIVEGMNYMVNESGEIVEVKDTKSTLNEDSLETEKELPAIKSEIAAPIFNEKEYKNILVDTFTKIFQV